MFQRSLMIFLAVGVGGYLLVCLAAVLFQERLIFFPGMAPQRAPSDVGLEYREARFASADGVELHGWFLPAAGSSTAVLVSHGNAGSVEHRIGLARTFVDLGHSVLLYDYRGYGSSGGRPTEGGTYLDAEAAWDWLIAQPEVDADRIALYGESLGGAVAIELARRRPAAALFVESTFTSVPDLGVASYPWLPVRLLARIDYPSVERIGRVTIPVLIGHSAGDQLIPRTHGQELFAKANEPKAWLETTGNHNDGGFQRVPAQVTAVADFLSGALR